MLEPILKGLVQWIYDLVVEIMDYAAGELVGVMSMDLEYFEKSAPIITDIVNIILALSWGLLLANMVFQSLKSMMSGAGFESEDPKHIFCRSFVFAFLLLASRQICNIALGMTGKVIEMLEIPSVLNFSIPDESMFSIGSGAKWLIVIIVGFILIFQLIKLLFEIGERYVVTSVLTFFAPLAFSMGGSKNTNDIFKGWCRMYGSMMIMMIMNIVFLKLILSSMANITSGSVLVWLVFIVALTRVARKIDSHIGKIGLNPAQTGDGVGSRLPGMMTAVAVRTMASAIGGSIKNSGMSGNGRRSGGERRSSRSHYHRSGDHSSSRSADNRSTTNAGSTFSGHTAGTGVSGLGTTSGTSTSSQTSSNQSHTSSQRSSERGQPRGKYGMPYIEVDERYNEFPNGNPAAHAARYGKPNPAGGINRETSSHTNDFGKEQNGTSRANVGGRTPNRPPIARNPVGGVNVGGTHNIGGVNAESSSSFVQSSATGGTQTNVSQGGSTDRSRSTSNSAGNIQNGGQVVNNTGGQSSSVVNNHSGSVQGNVNNNSHTDNISRQQTVNNHRQINHEYKNGRYNPAAVNKKQNRTLYQKQTTIKKTDSTTEMNLRKKRRNGGGRTEK